MAESTDVAIIGGGAAGWAVAYYLAQAGVKATVIEREGVGSQASGFAAGGLNPLEGAGIPGPLGPFAWESFQLHRSLYPMLSQQTGIDYQHRTVSELKLAYREIDLPGLQETFDNLGPVDGFEVRWVGPVEVSHLEPRAAPGVIRGLYARGNEALDSMKLTQALATASDLEVRAGEVVGLDGRAGKINKVLMADGEINCGQVVLALGPWSRKAEAWLDTYVPVDPLKGEILRLELPGGPLEHNLSAGGASIYAKPDGLAWCGTTEEWRGFDREPLEETRRSILKQIAGLLPEAARARLERHTACLRPVTPDWLPVLGLTPGWENVYQATGAGKKGILLAPGIGKSVAELMTVGETALSIGGFSPGRFAA